MLYRIQILRRSDSAFDVLLFDERGTAFETFSMKNISPIHAYVFIRGLASIFNQPEVADHDSIRYWNYFSAVYNARMNRN